MNSTQNTEHELFHEYYNRWIHIYKQGAIRNVTMEKYKMTQLWLKRLIPTLEICELTRTTYQQLLNDYAEVHEKQTTMDFHHQLKAAILDAIDEGWIKRDPTRKAIIKGKHARNKKQKFLNQFEVHKLLSDLTLGATLDWDWLIYLIAKTGMRFSEALGLTPKDFDFMHQTISINKTWDYKNNTGFLPTKNFTSNRKIQIDWQTVIKFTELLRGLPENEPIFVHGKVWNSTPNKRLERHCIHCGIPIITIHGFDTLTPLFYYSLEFQSLV